LEVEDAAGTEDETADPALTDGVLRLGADLLGGAVDQHSPLIQATHQGLGHLAQSLGERRGRPPVMPVEGMHGIPGGERRQVGLLPVQVKEDDSLPGAQGFQDALVVGFGERPMLLRRQDLGRRCLAREEHAVGAGLQTGQGVRLHRPGNDAKGRVQPLRVPAHRLAHQLRSRQLPGHGEGGKDRLQDRRIVGSARTDGLETGKLSPQGPGARVQGAQALPIRELAHAMPDARSCPV
jgi:hypothetical protein